MDYKKYAIVDLHLHLDGSLSAKAILKVAKLEGTKLPADNEKELNKYLMVPENCQSLNEYLERFALPNLVLQSKQGLEICTLDLLERLAKDGLKYVEIRMAPQLSTNKGLTQEEVVKTLIDTCKKAEKYGIFSNLILCMMRGNDTKEKNFETIEVTKKFLGKGVVAMDLAGAEGLFPNEMFKEEFDLINSYNIPLTIHAGEAAGAPPISMMLRLMFTISMITRVITERAILPCSSALTTNIIVAGRWMAHGLTLPSSPITMSLWQCAVTCTVMRLTPNSHFSILKISAVSGIARAVWTSAHLTLFVSMLNSMRMSKRLLTLTSPIRAQGVRIAFLKISVKPIAVSGRAKKILPSSLQRIAECCTMSPKICAVTSIGPS